MLEHKSVVPSSPTKGENMEGGCERKKRGGNRKVEEV